MSSLEYQGSSIIISYSTDKITEIVQELKVRVKHIQNSRSTVTETIDETGQTALHRAVAANDVVLVRELLAEDRDINAQDNQGWTPLHIACDRKYSDIILLLLKVCNL